MEANDLIFKIILLFLVFIITLLVAMYSTYAERKVAAFIQDRIGPNRAGTFGLLQPLADGVKMFMKEDIIPLHANKALFVMGPSIAMTTACLTGVIIPWGGELNIGGKIYSLQITDLNIGVLYIFAMVAIGVYGIMLGGWASNNKYALLGSVRAASQMISYELAMALAITALILKTGTLSLRDIVAQQQGWHWNIFYQPLGFLIFLVCAFAETNRAPFDMPECESELIGGYHTEYSSMRLGFYLFAEYINMFISSAVLATLYFGGYHMPFISHLGLSANTVVMLGTLFFFIKIFLLIFFFMWVRWTIPRFRYDQLMKLGWKGLLPLAFINIFITGLVMILL
ncbi:MAG: NADH-quinone oxidoreductase subunit NuoH [Bacteroidia bacterium]|nr:NADH-quinone oxidoreductase subunit NuoH [Bacteroidia bacterium]